MASCHAYLYWDPLTGSWASPWEMLVLELLVGNEKVRLRHALSARAL